MRNTRDYFRAKQLVCSSRTDLMTITARYSQMWQGWTCVLECAIT